LLSITVQHNKKRYLDYNNFRKRIFLAHSPKDSPIILYMLPWLLSVNHPSVPGYIKELKQSFRIFNIENDREILKRENFFKREFSIKEEKSLIRFPAKGIEIQGLYTIGSVGTISQTYRSDCDIWICIDKAHFDDKTWKHLNEKVNLIKDWLDNRIKLPVYFFLSDVEDIRNCNFGSLDIESSGSAQKNVLKEEFYRTTLLISGKIPFWWVCFDGGNAVDYARSFAQNARSDFGQPDFIDLGDLAEVNQDEFFGAALWQFNKSLIHPLKSIIKMFQLKVLLELPKEELFCHKFRKAVLQEKDRLEFPDPSIFVMNAVLDYASRHTREENFEFIKQCFYLRFDMKLMSKTKTLKEEMAAEVFQKYKINRRDIYRLNEFESWQLREKMAFGESIFKFLIDIYKDIVLVREGKGGEVAPQDLTIMGRKLSSSLEVKENKIPVLHIPLENIKLPVLTFATKGKLWLVNSSDDKSLPVIANEDIIFCLTYIIWNGIYDQGQTRMLPNQTSVTMQEIINLGRKIKDVFGNYDITGVNFGNFLQSESIAKMLLVISFEKQSSSIDINDLCVIYKNNWEELFVRRFASAEDMKTFFAKVSKISPQLETHYYIQRSNKYYEKIIERTKNIMSQMLKSN